MFGKIMVSVNFLAICGGLAAAFCAPGEGIIMLILLLLTATAMIQASGIFCIATLNKHIADGWAKFVCVIACLFCSGIEYRIIDWLTPKQEAGFILSATVVFAAICLMLTSYAAAFLVLAFHKVPNKSLTRDQVW